MSNETGTGYNNSHRSESELHDAPQHAHLTGELHGKQTSHSDPEASHPFEHHASKHHAFEHHTSHAGTFGHNDIAVLAHQLWEARGYPEGSPDIDWFHAVRELRLRHQNVS